ncbi:hypothetical protein P167DRAFT_540830 [Morchella conica CCBAS932]|uniref:Uncharacterized protein n=1 Tax=Morchella conica CCBAS932 TaxID=1392247 RepID=A0A3N4KD78_9PEZI|nr:hypothetical protein P167DRAFT_540830 [Morchella conica CCBAS932]
MFLLRWIWKFPLDNTPKPETLQPYHPYLSSPPAPPPHITESSPPTPTVSDILAAYPPPSPEKLSLRMHIPTDRTPARQPIPSVHRGSKQLSDPPRTIPHNGSERCNHHRMFRVSMAHYWGAYLRLWVG